MSYQLNKTDGTLLTELIDGQIDQSSTNITLFGKNYTGYGEHLNENFIKILENFSNTAAPSNPLTGQTWWDSSENRLKVYDGNSWKSSGGPFVQNTRPQMVAGDLWINNQTNQVFAYDGTDDILVGPIYTNLQGKSGFEIDSIIDTQDRSRTVAKLYIDEELVAVYSNLQFTPATGQRIEGLITDDNPLGIIFEGINVIDKANFVFRGTASSSNGLTTVDGEIIAIGQLLRSDTNSTTTGTLSVQNNGGIILGQSQNNIQRVIGNNFYIENQILNQDLRLRVRSSQYSGTIVDAITIDAGTGRVGIFNDDRDPEYTLDVQGDLRVTGDLLVEGDTVTVEVSTLSIEDKTIELAKISDSSLGDDSVADGGGIVVKSSDGDKSFTWVSATDSFTANQNIDLSSSSLVYKIGGSTKITNTSITNITKALDLDEIGTLVYLNVDNVNIDNNTVKAGSLTALSDPSDNPVKLRLIGTSGIDITAYGDIAVTDNQKITGVATPTSNQDVANKLYTDTTVATDALVLTMDITGLTDPNDPGVGDGPVNDIIGYLNTLYPPNSLNNGKLARILAISYTGSQVDGISVTVGTSGTVLTKSFVAVDSNGTQNESVVQDIASNLDASGTITLTPSRYIMIFSSNGVSWTHSSTTSA